MEDKKEQHVIPEHKEDGKKHDHYHGEHHFDGQGNHDDILDEDFNIKNSIYTSKRNLIFRTAAAGTFLALAAIGSAIDMFGERFFKLPLNEIILSIRYFDILIICLSIASIGPVFSSFIGVIMPWIHMLMDGDHPPLTHVVDSFGYFSVVWILWFFYYVVFRNSYIHKDKNRKKDLFKRYMPLVGFIPVSVIVYTAFTILIIFITDQSGHHHDDHDESIINKIISYHEKHEHEAQGDEWDLFKEKAVIYSFTIAGFELVRFSICGALFVILEPQMKKINHRYR
ncbi:ECF transporter S component [Spiroplasma tabanidicola]|uniref:ECF transporter S component n=1 Tax=Spiroplasma tabanidicola TaxID=324079 RepID=A0A6I6CC73_9MOLU|nr:ECF transporter S component [Spiroplasma tabanidicola]QGS51712.1 ECF transporter S component [Spiroplasma tabanidicola]